MPATPPDSPLTEADPQSLEELFSGDPTTYEPDGPEVRAIVRALREARARWLADGAQGKAKKLKPKALVPADITLEDLNLD